MKMNKRKIFQAMKDFKILVIILHSTYINK